MTEYHLAVITLSLIYLLASPLVVMMLFDMGGSGNGFGKDYAAAFIGWHLIGVVIAAFVGVIFAFWWAVDVIFI